MKRLIVHLHGHPVGKLEQDDSGLLRFPRLVQLLK